MPTRLYAAAAAAVVVVVFVVVVVSYPQWHPQPTLVGHARETTARNKGPFHLVGKGTFNSWECSINRWEGASNSWGVKH